MAKFPDVEYEVIQNRAVPFTKPQHYKKGSTTDTELTGHDNPLPVANYTQSTSGIWLPTSESNPVPTRLTGSIVELFNGEVEVSAGAFIGVTPDIENDGYREAWCTCIADKVHEFEIRLQMREGNYNMFQFTDDNDVSSLPIGGNLQSVLPKSFINSHIRIAIKNNDTEDRSYQITLRAE